VKAKNARVALKIARLQRHRSWSDGPAAWTASRQRESQVFGALKFVEGRALLGVLAARSQTVREVLVVARHI